MDTGVEQDSIREYYSGATSHLGHQGRIGSSLGGYCSSVEVQNKAVYLTQALAGYVIGYLSALVPNGAGTVTITGDNAVFTAPGDTAGEAVEVLDGETKILFSDDTDYYIRITRNLTTAPVDATDILFTITDATNGYSLADVPGADGRDGGTTYGCTIIRNISTASIKDLRRYITALSAPVATDTTQLSSSGSGVIVSTGDFSGWSDAGWAKITDGSTTKEIVYYTKTNDTTLAIAAAGRARLGTTATAGAAGDYIRQVPGVAIGVDVAGVQAAGTAVQTTEDEYTAPIVSGWSTGGDTATAAVVGDMGSGAQVGIWVKREIPPGVTVDFSAMNIFNDNFDVWD